MAWSNLPDLHSHPSRPLNGAPVGREERSRHTRVNRSPEGPKRREDIQKKRAVAVHPVSGGLPSSGGVNSWWVAGASSGDRSVCRSFC